VEWVKASYDSIHGKIASEWKQDGTRFELLATVPPNTTAILYLPAKAVADVTEGGKRLDRAEGVEFLRMENGRAVLRIGSGSYRFVSEAAR
jgi:alpha-L-rhamnosidase